MLLVVDVQDRLLQAFLPENHTRIIKNTRILVQSANILGIPIIVTEQYPAGLGNTCAEVVEVLPPGQVIHEKLDFSCYRSPGLATILEHSGRNQVVVCGIEAHICVLQTVLDLTTENYTVHVAADATGSRTNENWNVGLAMMRDASAVISSAETVAFQWLKRAGSDEFKKVSRLVR